MSVSPSQKKKAVILLSGGLDSATVLAIARDQDYQCYGLTFDYGQRHGLELESAKKVADNESAIVEHRIVSLDLAWMGGSALTDTNIDVPEPGASASGAQQVPITYVPARNTVFLSIALAWAEVLDAQDIFIGANAVDYSGYPDCRPVFIEAFEALANLATRAGIEGSPFHIHAPLISLSKADIIQKGLVLGVDYSLTLSCYNPSPQGFACGKCDACYLRTKGFNDAGVPDPICYG